MKNLKIKKLNVPCQWGIEKFMPDQRDLDIVEFQILSNELIRHGFENLSGNWRIGSQVNIGDGTFVCVISNGIAGNPLFLLS